MTKSASSATRIAFGAAVLAVPLIGLGLLLVRPELDLRWEHHPAHFWLVLGTAVVSAVLAYATGEAAGRRGDARLFYVSLAFLSSAGFLALHALATPGSCWEIQHRLRHRHTRGCRPGLGIRRTVDCGSLRPERRSQRPLRSAHSACLIGVMLVGRRGRCIAAATRSAPQLVEGLPSGLPCRPCCCGSAVRYLHFGVAAAMMLLAVASAFILLNRWWRWLSRGIGTCPGGSGTC